VTATNTVGSASANSNSTIAVPDVFWIATTSAYGNSDRTARNQATSSGVYITTQDVNNGTERLFLTSQGAISGLGIAPQQLTQSSVFTNYPSPGGPGNTSTSFGATTDISNGDIYTAGRNTSVGGNNTAMSRTNSSGGIVWYRRYSTNEAGPTAMQRTDSAGNQWISQRKSSSENVQNEGIFIKVNGNGDIISTFRGAVPTNRVLGAGDITTDNSNNFYYSMNEGSFSNPSAEPMFTTIIKANTTGSALTWQRQIVYSGQNLGSFRLQGYQDGVLVQLLHLNSNIDRKQWLMRFDGSGTLVWRKRVDLPAGDSDTGDIHIDASNNIWWTLRYKSSNIPRIVIHRIDPNGSLLLHRRIQGDGTVSNANGGSITTTGSVFYTSARLSTFGSTPSVVFKLPVDGSRTGVYGPWNYTTADTNFVNDTLTTITTVTRFTRQNISVSASAVTVTNTTFTPTVDSLVNV